MVSSEFEATEVVERLRKDPASILSVSQAERAFLERTLPDLIWVVGQKLSELERTVRDEINRRWPLPPEESSTGRPEKPIWPVTYGGGRVFDRKSALQYIALWDRCSRFGETPPGIYCELRALIDEDNARSAESGTEDRP